MVRYEFGGHKREFNAEERELLEKDSFDQGSWLYQLKCVGCKPLDKIAGEESVMVYVETKDELFSHSPAPSPS